MNNNIIKFYFKVSKLKETIRTGWKEVGIPNEKIESVADHISVSMLLALAIISEKNITDLDVEKVFKIMLVKELTKVETSEQSVLTNEDKTSAKVNFVKNLTNGMNIQDKFVALLNESNAMESNESKFVLYVSKLESDLQAKKYELTGDFTLENAKNDIENYPEAIKEDIKSQVENVSDGWILFNRRYYKGNEIFESLSNDIQSIK